MRIPQGLAISGGMIAVISIFLPWMTVTESVVGLPIQSEELTLLQFAIEGGSWWIMLPLFIVIAAVGAFIPKSRGEYFAGSILTLLPVLVIGIIGAGFLDVEVSFEFGFYLCIIGSLSYVAAGALVEDEKPK